MTTPADSSHGRPFPSPGHSPSFGRTLEQIRDALPASAFGAALCVQISALSWILAYRYGLSLSEIGWVWAAGPIAGIVGQLGAGFASDRTWLLGGRRRVFILAGGALCASFLLFLPHLDSVRRAFGFSSIVPVALVAVLGLDLAVNVGLGPARSLIVDRSRPGLDRARAFSWAQAISGAIGVICYAVAAGAGNGFLIPFGSALVLALSIVPIFFIRESRILEGAALPAPSEDSVAVEGAENLAPLGPAPSTTRRSDAAPGDSRALSPLGVCIAHAVTWLGFQLIFVFAATALGDSSGRHVALLFGILNVVGLLAPIAFVPFVTARLGTVYAHVACLLLAAVALTGMAAAVERPALLEIGMAIVGIGWGSALSLPLAIFSDAGAASENGARMGWFNLSIVVPQLAISVVGAPLVAFMAGHKPSAAPSVVASGAVFALAAGCFIVSAIAWIGVARREPKSAGLSRS